MKRFVLFATLSLALVFAMSAMADTNHHQAVKGGYGMIYGAPANTAKAVGDTTYLLGGPGSFNGRFEDASGNPDWQGWTHDDITFAGIQRWNVSTYNVPTGGGTYAAWCGAVFANACAEGYGNDWNENLVYAYTVPNPGVSTIVNLSCVFNSDSEPGFDYFMVQYNRGGVWQTVGVPYDGANVDVAFSAPISFTPADYVGSGGNQLQIRFHSDSDGAWSDEDCLWDTSGHAQVDNIVFAITGVPSVTFNFEDGNTNTFDDGDLTNLEQVFDVGVGDFSKIWVGLNDIDVCRTNYSAQVAFIDDGDVVPGTGGYQCTTWCYGPGGYIVNPEGGLAGPDQHINNLLISPVLTWPAGADAAYLEYEAYRHETRIASMSGIFYQWHVRSTTGDAQDLAASAWQDRNFVYYGGPDYLRDHQVVTDLLEPGRALVQMSLRCIEYGWVWGEVGVDGTPAPYFDNVAFVAFPYAGPGITAREIDIAQDSFPERGVLDTGTLANNWIRFDMARSISPSADLRNDPGDSLLFDIGLPRANSTLNQMPKIVVKMKANPLFDTARVLPPNFTQTGDVVDGWAYGDSTFQSNGTVVENRYNFDLPDSNLFFPGDVIHYYIEAEDNVPGGNPVVGTSTIPADLTGFDNFTTPLAYNSSFVVHGLPTMFDVAGNQPRILFWNDFANRGGENEWLLSLNNLGYNEGNDYDQYYTNGPSSGVGDGLGGRATTAVIDGYDVLLYTAGDLSVETISNGDFNDDPGNDVGLLDLWFQQGGKKAFFTGDNLVYSMTQAGGSTQAFFANYFGVQFIQKDLSGLIGNQIAPHVHTIQNNSVFSSIDEWIAFGGCLGINQFDAVQTIGATERVAEFLSPSGTGGQYPYAATTRKTATADVITMPYDLMFIYNAPGYVPPTPALPARAAVLQDILVEFGVAPTGSIIGVPDNGVFAVSNYPNPFNPQTTIKLNLPKAGHVSLKVFNVRGELVKTLVNGNLEAGEQSIVWDGSNDQGAKVASGVYFYETRANGEVKVNKMALVK